MIADSWIDSFMNYIYLWPTVHMCTIKYKKNILQIVASYRQEYVFTSISWNWLTWLSENVVAYYSILITICTYFQISIKKCLKKGWAAQGNNSARLLYKHCKEWLKRHRSRLLARVLKEGVQFWYNDTSTVKRGVRENVPLENLWSLRYFISVSVPSSVEIFQTHLALWVLSLCGIVPLCFFT
jgi:hypothetical protein